MKVKVGSRVPHPNVALFATLGWVHTLAAQRAFAGPPVHDRDCTTMTKAASPFALFEG